MTAGDAGGLSLRRRWARRGLFHGDRRLLRLRGLSRAEAAWLARAIRHLGLAPELEAAVAWYPRAAGVLERAASERLWVTAETVDALLAERAGQGLWPGPGQPAPPS